MTRARQLAEASGLLESGRQVLVLLSGGRDSTCLLDVAVTISGTPCVRALHVNYGLRPSAAEEAEHCRALCGEFGVPIAVLDAAGPPATGNRQAWARELRYARARELAGAADIAAGHTATDQVETILYRLASSPSRRALLGMRPREGALIRPLLAATREETAGHCRERGLGWREDETNESDAYARGRVRARLVPALREIHPAAEENVLAVAELLREEAEVLEVLVAQALAGRSEIPLAELAELPRAVARLVVQRLADAAAGAPAPGTARRIEEILVLRDNAALDLPHGIRALLRRGVLRMERPSPPCR
jgi:tRNA(Ile)-lysidine synthase